MAKQLSDINQLKALYRISRSNPYKRYWAREKEEYARSRKVLAARRLGIPGPPAVQRPVRLFRYI